MSQGTALDGSVSVADVIARCDSYHVPEHLTRHIDYVTPGVKLSAPLKKSVVKRDGRNWGPWSGPSGPWQGSRPGPRPGPSFAPVAPSAGPPHWNPPQMTLPEDLRTCGANITVSIGSTPGDLY